MYSQLAANGKSLIAYFALMLFFTRVHPLMYYNNTDLKEPFSAHVRGYGFFSPCVSSDILSY